MRKVVLGLLSGLALAACQSSVPNSAAGVGFGDYETYLRQREAELRGQQAAQAPAPAPAAPAPGAYGASGYGATPVTSSAGLAAAPAPTEGTIGADALAALRATSPGGEAAAAAPVTTDVGAPLDAMAPAAVPVPSGSTGPNLAAYALAATNAPGQQAFQRGGLHLISSTKACGKYISPDLAQMAFLKKGGPQKDPLNLDPDGDGFACGWDPRPFQTARQ